MGAEVGAGASGRPPPTLRLSGHALGQRHATLTAKLDHLGDTTVDDSGPRRSIRSVRIVGKLPGDELPTMAVFDYQEIYRRVSGSRWELIGYTYEYRDEVRGGRRAYHLHDGRFHAHCVDPAAGRSDHHYRAPEMDVFEAHDEFSRMYVAELPVRCDDLRPALVAAYFEGYRRIPDTDDEDFKAIERTGIKSLRRLRD